jgi:hypothetical protein
VLARRRAVLVDEVEARLAGDVAQVDAPRIRGRRGPGEKGQDEAGEKGVAKGRGAPYRVRAR